MIAPRPTPLRNLHQQAYDLLLQRILRVEPGYEPGSRLSIPELVEELGVSATPIKESLRLLQAYGLVTMSPRRGTFIASLAPAELDAHIDVLRELEFAALRLARGRVAPEQLDNLREQVRRARISLEADQVVEVIHTNQGFHEALVALSGNDQLLQLYCSPRAYLLSTVYGPRDREAELFLISQHEGIVEALALGDTDLALERMAAHWEATRRFGHATLRTLQDRRSGSGTASGRT